MAIKNREGTFQNLAVAGNQRAGSPFSARETHGIALWRQNRLLMHSEGMNWKGLYASFATENNWSAKLPANEHLCLAYCVHQGAVITRRFEGERNAESAELRARQIGTIPSGVSSQWRFEGCADVLLLYLHRALLQGVAEEVLQRDGRALEIRPLLGTVDPLLEQLALAALGVLRQRDATQTLYIESIAQMIAVQLLNEHAAGGRRHADVFVPAVPMPSYGLQRVVDFIESALDTDLSLATLASQAGMSPFYFARAFREQLGEAPHRYVLRRRIERARELLLQTSMSPVEIALATGFSSQSHLTSAFKRLVGRTPGEYRRSGR